MKKLIRFLGSIRIKKIATLQWKILFKKIKTKNSINY